MIDYNAKIAKFEERIKSLEIEKEKQKVRFDNAKEKLKEYEINSFDEINDVISNLEKRISEMKIKLDTNLEKFDAVIRKYEELI